MRAALHRRTAGRNWHAIREAADEIVIVANQRHLSIVEVRQRHRAKIELPVVRACAGAAVDRVEGPVKLLGFALRWLRAAAFVKLRRHPAGARLRIGLRQLPSWRTADANVALENLHAQRLVVWPRVAIGDAAVILDARPRDAAPEVVELAAGRPVDEHDARRLDQRQLDAFCRLLQLLRQIGVQGADRIHVGGVHCFRQPDIVELAQMIAQRRIDLRFRRANIEPEAVLHALAPGQRGGRENAAGC